MATMPLATLLFLLDTTLVDLGSYYAPTDEETEVIHFLYEKMCGRRRDRARVRSILRASCTMAVEEPGKSLGARSGYHLPPTGHRPVDAFIASSVRAKFEFICRDGAWIDEDGESHAYEEEFGLAGPLPTNATDPQRAGRAILLQDIEAIVFGGAGAVSIKRSNPPNIELTSADQVRKQQRRRVQIQAIPTADILAASYTKEEMRRDIEAYGTATPTPGPEAEFIGEVEKSTLFPRASANRKILALALNLWRSKLPSLCDRVHVAESARLSALQHRVLLQPTTIQRRQAARERLRATGKLCGLQLKTPSAPGAERDQNRFASSEEPVLVLAEKLERHRNIPGSTKSDEGASMDAANHFVNSARWRPPVAEGEDGALSVQRLRVVARSLKGSSNAGSVRGREAQMKASRSLRRAAEIEMLRQERLANIAKSAHGGLWSDNTLQPPAASIGNASSWRRPEPAKLPAKTLETSQPVASSSDSTSADRTPSPATKKAAPKPSRVSRRPQTCSCCSQMRSLGHSKVCPHTNKVCSRCTK